MMTSIYKPPNSDSALAAISDSLLVPKTTAYKRWNCQVIRPANCCHLIPSNRFLVGFPDLNQFSAAKPTHYSTIPHRPSDSSRHRQRLLLSGDVHQNPGPAYQISMFRVYKQRHKLWGELYVQSLFWLGSFEVFWFSNRSGVELKLGMQLLQVPTHSTNTKTASITNYN